MHNVTEPLQNVTEYYGKLREYYGTLQKCYGMSQSLYRMLWSVAENNRALQDVIEHYKSVADHYGTLRSCYIMEALQKISILPIRPRMHSSAACASCTMPTADESSYSAATSTPLQSLDTSVPKPNLYHSPIYCSNPITTTSWYSTGLHADMPSVLWCCGMGSRKGIRPAKNRVVVYWRSYLSEARCRFAYGPADATATHCLLFQENPDSFYLSGTGLPG